MRYQGLRFIDFSEFGRGPELSEESCCDRALSGVFLTYMVTHHIVSGQVVTHFCGLPQVGFRLRLKTTFS